MRWYIIRTLLLKELLRHVAERGAIFLALLLIGAAMLISLFGKEETQGAALMGAGIKRCYIDYWEPGPWVEHLRTHPPAKTLGDIRFRVIPAGLITYAQNEGAIQIRLNGSDSQGNTRYRIQLWHAGDAAALGPYVDWFWKETLNYYQSQGLPVEIDTQQDELIHPADNSLIHVQNLESKKKYLYWRPSDNLPLRSLMNGKQPVEMEVSTEELMGRGDLRSSVATALVIFAICFFSIYLMPCLTCEERERGVLLAQVLSPASTAEILAAKFLFYPTIGMTLGIVLTGIFEPRALLRPFFWLGLIVTTIAYLGVGLTIASLATSQRKASMGAMCYMLTLALILSIANQFNVPFVHYLAIEYYSPRIIHAALVNNVHPYRWNLVAAAALAVIWTVVSVRLFRQRGWQ